MYEDFLGKNRQYIETQMRERGAYNRIVAPSNQHISYKIRDNFSVGFYLVQKAVDMVILTYGGEVSPEKVIKDMGYSFSECQPIGEGTYSIESATGMKRIMIYDTPEGTSAFLSG